MSTCSFPPTFCFFISRPAHSRTAKVSWRMAPSEAGPKITQSLRARTSLRSMTVRYAAATDASTSPSSAQESTLHSIRSHRVESCQLHLTPVLCEVNVYKVGATQLATLAWLGFAHDSYSILAIRLPRIAAIAERRGRRGARSSGLASGFACDAHASLARHCDTPLSRRRPARPSPPPQIGRYLTAT